MDFCISQCRDNYQNNPQNKKDASGASYNADPNKAKEAAHKEYNKTPEPKKAASHDQYRTQSETIKEEARKQYIANPEPKKKAARKQYSNHPEKKKAAARVRLALNRDNNLCTQKRAKYALGEPKLDVKDMYVKEILSHLLTDAEARSLVSNSFPKMHINDKINVSVKAMCRVAAKKLLNKAL